MRDGFGAVLIIVVLFVICFVWYSVALHKASTTPIDDTDKSEVTRSGMVLRIDHGTGCEYLEPYDGNYLIPRLDKNGNHICTERNKNP